MKKSTPITALFADIANALADWWCIFTDASGENERVQASERSGEGANPFFRLITKQRHGFCGPLGSAFLSGNHSGEKETKLALILSAIAIWNINRTS